MGLTAGLIGCAGDPNDIMVQLSPEVISSIDGTVSVHALVLANRDPVAKGKTVDLTVDYTDRNGTAHMIAPISGTTDERGALDAKFEGLKWDGTGTIKASLGTVVGEATFAVLDRTPPKVTITGPATVSANNGATFMVHVTDEIGVSEVFFEASGGNGNFNNRQRSTVVASGSVDATIPFDFQIGGQGNIGQTITLYALASDLSGNQAAATPITAMITP
jgi:hypothetical protein